MIPLYTPDTVTISHADAWESDVYGNQVPVYTDTVWPAQIQANDNTADLESSVATDRWRMFCPPGITVATGDQVAWGDRTLKVIGNAIEHLDLFTGAASHLEIALEVAD